MKQLNKYKLDIIALQETHIKESGISQIENYFLLNSGSEITRFGVGFLISMEMKVRLRNFTPLSDRLCYMEFEEGGRVALLNVYAPTEGRSEEEKDIFYEKGDNKGSDGRSQCDGGKGGHIQTHNRG